MNEEQINKILKTTTEEDKRLIRMVMERERAKQKRKNTILSDVLERIK